MFSRLMSFLLVLGLLVAAGCGSDDATTDPPAVESTDDTADAGSGDGSDGATQGGPTADLGDFPIPAPPGGVAALISDEEDIKAYIVTFQSSEFDAVISFYDDWTSSESDEYQRVVAESGGVSWLRISGPDNTSRIIALSAPIEGDETTFVTLTDATG